MTNPQAQELPQFWNVTYPFKGDSGSFFYLQEVGQDEQHARILADTLSRAYGNAKITNRQGLVASYVNGVERHFQLKPVQAKTSRWGNFLTKLRSLLK